jgi:hypothetical protein
MIDLRPLKSDLGYVAWILNFDKFVASKALDRAPSALNYYLLYDLDEKKYCIESDRSATFNQIILRQARIPSKKDLKNEVEIKDYEFID